MNYDAMKKEELIAVIRQLKSEKMDAPPTVVQIIRELRIDYSRESFILIVVDNKLKTLKRKVLFTGGVETSLVDMRVLLREAITVRKCSGIIIAHNHPSNDCTPSQEDIMLTKRVMESCTLMGISFIDSIIFSEYSYLSLKESNYM